MTNGIRAARLLAVALPAIFAIPQDGQRPIPPEAQSSLDKGIRWLLSAQNRDGSWGRHKGSPGDVGNTCIATLALLSTGDSVTRGKYCFQLRRGVQYIRSRIKGWGIEHRTLDGDTEMRRYLGQNFDLYLACLLYSQTIGQGVTTAEQEEMQAEMRRMTDYIASQQKSNGEFEASYEPMLTTITAWLALRQAHDSGITIHGASVDKVLEYLKKDCYDHRTGAFRERKWNREQRFVTQAGGIRVLFGMAEGKTAEAQKAAKVMLKMPFCDAGPSRASGEAYLGAVFATQGMHMERDANWKAWYRKITRALIGCQNSDGSWVGYNCISGRVFCTACAILSMHTPNKLMPMTEK